MQIIKSTSSLRKELWLNRISNRTIGLVPTMGALHEGHASLVKRCLQENDVTVVSIFVNPTQFNDPSDLEKYPRTLESDCHLLENLGVSIAFVPSVEEMYPEKDIRVFSYPPTDTVMEGIYRPGHFNGVCQIVSKLFLAVEPNRAYFGEKDFQQIAVIRSMVKDQGYPLEICSCPIVREKDGLALSSRNRLLNKNERKVAANIYKTLHSSLEYSKSHTLEECKSWVINEINSVDGLEVQYYEIVDGNDLHSLCHWSESDYIVGCITVFCGNLPVRLIDNIVYK